MAKSVALASERPLVQSHGSSGRLHLFSPSWQARTRNKASRTGARGFLPIAASAKRSQNSVNGAQANLDVFTDSINLLQDSIDSATGIGLLKTPRHECPKEEEIPGRVYDDPQSGFSVFLKKRTKTIYFIRHAEGTHNQAAREAGGDHVLVGDMSFWDAPLNPTGIDQCLKFRRDVIEQDDFNAELVVVSPLTRTLQTAMFCMGPLHGTPSPVHRQDGSMPPFIALEMCRERYGKYTCDGRRPISEISPDFPNVDFSLVEDDVDVYWNDEREPDEECAQRAIHFLEWLSKRPESSIAVVTHSSFMRHMFAHNWSVLGTADGDHAELHRTAGNCELRTVVLCSHSI